MGAPNWKILVVEDSRFDRKLLRRLIDSWPGRDCIVLEAESGEQGLELIRRERPDCILLDYNLTDIDGLEFLKRLAGDDPEPKLPVVMLTGAGSEQVAVRAMKLGAADYIVKGEFTHRNLQFAVTAVIERGSMRRELEEKRYELQRSTERLERANVQLKEQTLALSISETRWRTLFECAPEAIIVHDVDDDVVVDANRNALELFKLDREALLGRGLFEISPPEQPCGGKSSELSVKHTGETLAGKDPVFEWVFVDAEGEEVTCEVRLACLPSPGNRLVRGSLTDISERRVLETQLRQAQKLEAIGQLAAGIAHEVNTPIQYVGDNLRFLQESFGELTAVLEKLGADPQKLGGELAAAIEQADVGYLAEEIPRAITQSLDGAGRVSKIIRAMKEFSHPGGEEKQAIDLNRSIESTVTVARNEWKYVADLELDLDPELPPVPCLQGDFNQVVLNLVVNAAHAIAERNGDNTGDKGTITVSTRTCGDSAEIRIADTGSGIPEEIRRKVFDPFFTTKAVGKGTGQGLSIAHHVVVQKHDGEISLDSRVGEGTTFRIRLPLVEAAEVMEEVPA